MRDLEVIIWGILAGLIAIALRWSFKRADRKPGSSTPVYIIGFALGIAVFGALIQAIFGNEPTSLILGRVVFLVAGTVHAIFLFKLPIAKRSGHSFKEDSYVPEVLFTLFLGLLCSIGFMLSPRVFKVIRVNVDAADYQFWEAPIVFFFPFLVAKVIDLAGQVPFRFVEKMWYYPIEAVNTENWPWRDLVRLEFNLATSLKQEYRFFGNRADPWIEIPRESNLGSVFRLTMQERIKKTKLTTIQDMGIEYAGDPEFWWLFKVKIVWWRPETWFRPIRYLDPDISIAQNDIKNNDVILAYRIPAQVGQLPGNEPWTQHARDDDNRTVIINRDY